MESKNTVGKKFPWGKLAKGVAVGVAGACVAGLVYEHDLSGARGFLQEHLPNPHGHEFTKLSRCTGDAQAPLDFTVYRHSAESDLEKSAIEAILRLGAPSGHAQERFSRAGAKMHTAKKLYGALVADGKAGEIESGVCIEGKNLLGFQYPDLDEKSEVKKMVHFLSRKFHADKLQRVCTGTGSDRVCGLDAIKLDMPNTVDTLSKAFGSDSTAWQRQINDHALPRKEMSLDYDQPSRGWFSNWF
jgi:hypothetical protein